MSLLFVSLLAVLYLSQWLQETSIENFEPVAEPKHAIVVLTRGYDTDEKYNLLTERNNSIYDVFYSKLNGDETNKYDILIYHEGNITPDQQDYIQRKTPNLPLIFKTIQLHEDQENNELCPPTLLSKSFSNGYKNMCYFWSIDFLEYLKEYDYIIRIDEDCTVEQFDKDTLQQYKESNIMFSSPSYQDNDSPEVIVGMDTLFNTYLSEHNMKQKNTLKMPYTNFMIVNIPFFTNHDTVKSVLDRVKESKCIFSNRWGDLPIWGYVLSYFIDKQYYLEDKDIRYYHGSHGAKINESNKDRGH